jgi:hypothetical protein
MECCHLRLQLWHCKYYGNHDHGRDSSNHFPQIGLALVTGISWKIVKRTRFRKAKEVDLTAGLGFFQALDEHYRRERDGVPTTRADRIMAKIF